MSNITWLKLGDVSEYQNEISLLFQVMFFSIRIQGLNWFGCGQSYILILTLRGRVHHPPRPSLVQRRLFFEFLYSAILFQHQCESIYIFSCDQAALQMVFSVRPSVRLSVCLSVRLSVTPFSPCSHHRIIMKFSGVITMVKSDVHAKGQGQRSKVKVTKVNVQLSRFRTLTPVWIHIWQWNHAHSWKQHRRGALLFFKVIHQISRSHGSKNSWIWPRLGVSGL